MDLAHSPTALLTRKLIYPKIRMLTHLTEVKLATRESESLMFDLFHKTPSVKRFSIGGKNFLPILVQHMSHHSFLPGLWSLECKVRDADSIVEVLQDLGPVAFTQLISDDYPGVRLTLVLFQERDILPRCKVLTGNS